MTNFKVGQKVVCIRKGNWYCDRDRTILVFRSLPKYGETCTINELNIRGTQYFSLEGYEYDTDGGRLGFLSRDFRPISEYTDATQEILSKFKPTEDTPDVEIKKHELTT
jgi:hypothetical protein